MWFTRRPKPAQQFEVTDYECFGCGGVLDTPYEEQCPWCGYDQYGDELADEI